MKKLRLKEKQGPICNHLAGQDRVSSRAQISGSLAPIWFLLGTPTPVSRLRGLRENDLSFVLIGGLLNLPFAMIGGYPELSFTGIGGCLSGLSSD